MQTARIGDFGESLIALLLQLEYQVQHLLVVRVGAENLPFDLMALNHPAGTPFEDPSPAVFSVKTRGGWSDVIPPARDRLAHEIAESSELGFTLWLAFLRYEYQDTGLSYQAYMLPAALLDEDQDFRRVRRSGREEEQIITGKMIEKSALRFFSQGGR